MEEMTRLFNLDAQLFQDTILLAIAVFFLFMALSYLLFNPVRTMLKNRQEGIANDIKAAEDDKKDAAALKAEYEAKLKDIDKEAEHVDILAQTIMYDSNESNVRSALTQFVTLINGKTTLTPEEAQTLNDIIENEFEDWGDED